MKATTNYQAQWPSRTCPKCGGKKSAGSRTCWNCRTEFAYTHQKETVEQATTWCHEAGIEVRETAPGCVTLVTSTTGQTSETYVGDDPESREEAFVKLVQRHRYKMKARPVNPEGRYHKHQTPSVSGSQTRFEDSHAKG